MSRPGKSSLVKELSQVALWMDPHQDQVAVAKLRLARGERILCGAAVVTLRRAVLPGHRFAVRDIPANEWVRQLGYVFGRSKGIKAGELITVQNLTAAIPTVRTGNFRKPLPTRYAPELLARTFLGYSRSDGKVGTRNYYLVVPTSLCASATCVQIARQASALHEPGAGFDGVVAIPHTEGCGCDSGLSIGRLLRILKGYMAHPNVGGCLVVDLGCEQTDRAVVGRYLNDFILAGTKPLDWLTIETGGGVEATRAAALRVMARRIKEVSRARRKPAPLAQLVLGTECGASDSFSGITANPLIGNVADKVVRGKGAAILSEMPEMVGTFPMLFPRFRSPAVADKFLLALQWYEDLARKMGVDLSDNLVPKNIAGGLVNSYIKSLGAVLKGGTTMIEDVVGYGEPLRRRGLSIMQGPGGDLESVTGLVASGATVVCFSTGQGTPTGNAICPVIKVASNNDIFERLRRDLDFNAGRLLTETAGLEALGDELLDVVVAVASGKTTAAERLGQQQFQIWTAGKLSL